MHSGQGTSTKGSIFLHTAGECLPQGFTRRPLRIGGRAGSSETPQRESWRRSVCFSERDDYRFYIKEVNSVMNANLKRLQTPRQMYGSNA